MDVGANSGAFYAPFLFAPTVAAPRPHHIGRIPAHSMRAWTYGRIAAHIVRANPGAFRAGESQRTSCAGFIRTYDCRATTASAHHHPPVLFAPTVAAPRPHHIGRIPAHSMRAWTGRRGEYRRTMCAVFIRPYGCRATTASADSPTHS